jgi:hypothetical protein
MSRDGQSQLFELPSLHFWKILALILAATTFALSRWQPIYWEDVWIYLGTGRYILSHHMIPRGDVFSWSVAGARWVNTDWLYEVLLTVLVRGVGLFGVSLLKNLLVLLSLFFVDKRLRFWRAGAIERVFFLGLVFLGGWPFWVERADLSSLAFFSALLWTIDRSFLSPWGRSRWLLWIVLFAFWANLHGQFTFGLFVLAVYTVFQGLTDRYKARAIVAGTTLCAAATFINPYGAGLHLGILRFMNSPVSDIYEWMPPRGLGFLFFDLSFGLVLVSYFIRRTYSSQVMYSALLVLFLGYSACWHQRFVHFFMVGAFPYAAVNWLESRPRAWLVKSTGAYEKWALAVLCLVLLWISVSSAHAMRGGIDTKNSGYIEEACDFIEHWEIRGPFYNEYKFGAYWLYRFQGNPAEFQDGRDSVVDGFDRVIRICAQAKSRPETWIGFLNHYGIEAAVIHHPLVPPEQQFRVLDRFFPPSQWLAVYQDDLCVLLLRRHSKNERVIRALESGWLYRSRAHARR